MKKQWISVKCGLSRDPKHRRQMGKTVWTFLHMLDIADWQTGIIHDWKDENAAEDMGIDIRVLREDRRKLEQDDYISCKQKQYGQDITIHNWTNPREYSGEVYNKKQSYEKYPPSNDAQGDTQGYIQGSRKDVTPTYDSKIKESKDISLSEKEIQEANALVDAIISNGQKQPELDSLHDFERSFGFGALPWYSNTAWDKFAKWIIKQAGADWFSDYVIWRNGEGKYKSFSNKKIRENPAAFMDTGYPEYEASKMYRQTDESRPEYQPFPFAGGS